MNRRTAAVLLALVIAGGGALRLVHLGKRSIWFDEAVAWTTVTQFSWSEMVQRTGQAVHPPGFYVLLRLWCGVWGASLVAMRSLAVCLALGSFYVVYLFCRDAYAFTGRGFDDESRRRGRAVGVTAAALLAVSSYHVCWSQQARMYSLGCLLAACSSWCLLHALGGNGRRILWWSGYAFAAAALAYTHNYGLFTIFAQACFALGWLVWTNRRRLRALSGQSDFRFAALGFSSVALMYAPWIGVLLRQTERVRNNYWIGELRFTTLPRIWFKLFFPSNQPDPPSVAVAGAVSVASLALMGVFLRRRRPGDWLTAALVVVPMLCAVGVSLLVTPITVTRYFLFVQVFFLCIVADLAWRLHSAELRNALIVVLIGNSMLVHGVYWSQLGIGDKPGLRGAVEHAQRRRRANEPMIVIHPSIYHSVKFYLPEDDPPRLLLEAGEVAHYKGGPLLTSDDACHPEELNRLPVERIWVFDTTGYSTGYERIMPPKNWRIVPGSARVFPEVNWYQREVIVSQYERVGKNETVNAPSS